MAIPVLLVFAAFLAGAYELMAQAQERATARHVYRQLGAHDLANRRWRQLRGSFGLRLLTPVAGQMTSTLRRLAPAGHIEAARRRLNLAGWTGEASLERYLAVRVLAIALVPVWAVVLLIVRPLGGLVPVALFGLLAGVSVAGPDAVVKRRAEERRGAIRAQLPDILDLLVISVEAGLGFEQALDGTVARVPGPLAEEMARALGEMRAGASREDALRALDARTDVSELRSFILAVVQAEAFGISIGRVLHNQADEMRVRRRQLAQERAQKAPVKMLVPMVFCVFPALFVVVLGPGMINIYRQLIHR